MDAISGATITSQALGKTLDQWFGFYKNYLAENAAVEVVEAVIDETGELEQTENVEPSNTVEE